MRIKIFILTLSLSLIITASANSATLTNTDPHVGEQVIFSVQTSQIPSGGSVEWSVAPTTGKTPARISLRAGGREFAFTPLDTKPVKVTANFINSQGDIVETSEKVINPGEFVINASVVVDKPLTLWDAEKHSNFVLEPSDLLANTPIKIRAELAPDFKGEHTFKWVSDAATALMSQDNDEIFIRRGSVGESELTVTAFNSSGIRLGQGSTKVKINIPMSRYEDSSREREAWNLWQKAQESWEAKNYAEGVKLATRAAGLAPRDKEISEGLRAMNTNFARFTKAEKLRSDAVTLDKNKKFDDALKNLRAAAVIWPLDTDAEKISEAERKVNDYRLLVQQSNWLIDTGRAYDSENMFEEAIDYYTKGIAIVSNDAVSERIERIKNRLTLIANADKYAGEGNTLEREGNLTEALQRYGASVLSNPDATLKAHIEELQNVISRRERQAQALYREGNELLRKNQNQEALKRFRESLNVWPNDQARQRANQLRNVRLPADTVLRGPEDFGIGTRIDAQRITNQADELYAQGKFDEALALYRRAQTISANPQLKDWLTRFERTIRERDAVNAANKQIAQANALYKAGKVKEALDLYRQSLATHPNPEIEAFLKRQGAASK